MENENVVFLQSRKIELTEELNSTPLYLINGLKESAINSLNNIGINTLGELLKTDTCKLYHELFDYWMVRCVIMQMGLLFNDDHINYESIGISDEIALIPIESLNISKEMKHVLARIAGIYFLGDLLSCDYMRLLKLRDIGEDGLIELKNYIHSLGYSLRNEKPLLSEIIEEYKTKGIPLIQEELNLDENTSIILYRNGIYTVNDLIKYGEKVFNLFDMGELNSQKLKEAMQNNNIQFGTTAATDTVTNDFCNQLETDDRMNKIKTLLLEIQRLFTAKEELIARENLLDEEIQYKMALLRTENNRFRKK